MVVHLHGWHLGKRLASLAISDSCAQRLSHAGLEFLRLNEGAGEISREIAHHPSGKRFLLSAETYCELATCEDFDVFEIGEDGRAIRCFSNASDDNAIVITGRCNSSCIMCPDSDKARARAATRSLETLLQLVRHIPSDARHLTVTGGEPFLIGPDLFKLFEAMTEKFTNTDFLLLTNGRIFAIDSYCRELKRTLPARATIGIPLHGFDARSHDGITQAPGSFDQTLAGVKSLIKLGMRVELRVVVSRVSAENMDSIADLIVREISGVSCVKIIGLEMLGSAAKNRDAIWITYPHAFAKSKQAIMTLIAHGIDVGIYNFPLCSVDREFWPICEKSISDYKVRFPEECDCCAVRDACGGVFAGTQRFAIPDIRKVEKEDAPLFNGE